MLAERSGLHRHLEQAFLQARRRHPKLSTLTALSIALGCSIDTMLRGEEPEVFLAVEKELLEKFRALDARARPPLYIYLDKEYSRKKARTATLLFPSIRRLYPCGFTTLRFQPERLIYGG